MGFRPLPFGFREVHRLRQVINVLVKYGFGWVVDKTGLSHLLSLGRRLLRFQEKAPLSPPQRLRRVLEELGPSFIKLGQILSTRPDLIPSEFIPELQKLRDEVAPFSWKEIEHLLNHEWGLGWENLLEIPAKDPLASASIAQVYKGTLTTGEEVVVKVLRPGIRETVKRDIEVMRVIARLLERYLPESRLYHPVDLVEEFAFTIMREMDFTVEAANAEKMRANMKGFSWVIVPKIYWDLTAPSLLIMEHVGGVRLDQGEVLEDKGIDRVLVARRLVTAFLKQVLEDGFFHADPHPSNILVGDEGELIQVDFGMMGYLDKSMRQAVATLLFRIVRRDYDGIIRVFKKVGVMEGGLDERRFKLELMGLLEPYFSRTLEGMPLGTVVNQVMHLSLKYRIRFPPEFYLLGRALVLVDSNLRYLYPELNVIEVVTPFALKILRERHQPRKIVESLGEEWEGIREGIRVFPSQMLQVLQRINKGDVHLYLTHEGLEELKEVMERNSLRLSITLLLALFVVMGTWGLSSPWGWEWQVVGLPFFPLVSYGLAVGMGVFLLGSLLFKKR